MEEKKEKKQSKFPYLPPISPFNLNLAMSSPSSPSSSTPSRPPRPPHGGAAPSPSRVGGVEPALPATTTSGASSRSTSALALSLGGSELRKSTANTALPAVSLAPTAVHIEARLPPRVPSSGVGISDNSGIIRRTKVGQETQSSSLPSVFFPSSPIETSTSSEYSTTTPAAEHPRAIPVRRNSAQKRKSISRSYYADGSFLSANMVTIPSSAVRQQTLEFSYQEYRIPRNFSPSASPDAPRLGFVPPVLAQSPGEGISKLPLTSPLTQLSALRQISRTFEAQVIAESTELDDDGEPSPWTQQPSDRAKSPVLQLSATQSTLSEASSIEFGRTYFVEPIVVPPHVSVNVQQPISSEGLGLGVAEDPLETTPLLSAHRPHQPDTTLGPNGHQGKKMFGPVNWLSVRGKIGESAAVSLRSIPAVVLGVILNLLDALSYGIIIFPASGAAIPSTATQAGISMFLLSTFICQLIFTLGGSAFPGANGSMMIEVMPFLHIMVRIIEDYMGSNAAPEAVLATIMVAYAVSTVLTGVAFLLLGFFKLGNIIQFFPRHILVGCIGGIGWFLFVTGIEVTTGIQPQLSLEFLSQIFDTWNLFLWGSSLAAALLLKGLQQRFTNPLFVPLFYMTVPVIFYVVTLLILGLSIEDMRKWGLLFNMPEESRVPFWTFWTYFNGFQGIDWGAVMSTLGTQLALIFFAVLHVPINVPALAVSMHQSVDVNHEIVGHGWSNLVGGLFGVPQSYLVYSNSLLFIRSGGNSHIAGFMLAVATFAIMIAGGSVIGFVPTLVVGSLIFHLAFDLMKESIWDTWGSGISGWEYSTIISIVFIMGFFGFTEGILAGVILACFFFVVMYSRKSIIRGVFSGEEMGSTVHRSHRQRTFLDEVAEQVRVIKIQGFIFFGVIAQLETAVDELLKSPRVRFIVLDFALITGVDFSAMEAFHRLKRLLVGRGIQLIFCDLGVVGAELARSGIFEDSTEEASNAEGPAADLILAAQHQMVHNFETLNEALEYCENELLANLYRIESEEKLALSQSSTRSSDRMLTINTVGWDSPRSSQIRTAASAVLHPRREKRASVTDHPVTNFFLSVEDGPLSNLPAADYAHLARFFFEVEAPKGSLLWAAGSDSTELFIVETGELAQVTNVRGKNKIIESLLPGTMVGELELFSNRKHACRLVATERSILWRMDREGYAALCQELPNLAVLFMRFCLSFDAFRFANALVQHH
ncbi:sulfate transporter family-domain-containing protein [Zopfochytrium polystomum]|nr:sulfate transporter family-domain-containing protein [Zopfochytrium polystomum]